MAEENPETIQDVLADALAERHPDQIDVYVDGCWLYRGRSQKPQNPHEAGAWGAVVVARLEGEEIHRWHVSGVLKEWLGKNRSSRENSHLAEIRAVRCGLEAVQSWLHRHDGPRPAVTVHSDDHTVAEEVARWRNGTLSPEARNVDCIERIANLLDAMSATLTLTKPSKHKPRQEPTEANRCMDRAHELASAAAWRERFRTQEYIGTSEGHRITGPAAEKILNAKSRLAWQEGVGGLER